MARDRLPEIEKSFLTKEERAKYDDLTSGNPDKALTHGEIARAFIVPGASYLALNAVVLPPLLQVEPPTSSLVAVGVVLVITSVLFVWMAIVAAHSAIEKKVDRYLESINYRARANAYMAGRYRPSDDDDGSFPPLRHSQHSWYGDNRGFSWSDRVVGQQHGMDVDTYMSNYRDAD